MAKKLYVGNLSYTTTEDELRKLFSEVGTVASVAIITDRETGRSKGFGFVEMENDKAADAAIEKFNNYQMNQRNLTVNEARPPRERSFGGGGGGGGSRRPGGDRGGESRGGSGGRFSRGGGERGGDRGERGGERRRF